MPRDIDSMLNDRLSGKKKSSGLSRTSGFGNSGGMSRGGMSSGLGMSSGMGMKKGSKSCLKKSVSMAAGMGSRKVSLGNARRGISFDKFDRVLEIEHINDMPESQINAVWMKPEESRKIRKDAIKIVEEVNSGMVKSDSVEGFRGLEGHTDDALRERQEIRDNVYDAVLGLQEFQRRRGVNLPNAMADIYKRHSARAQREAQKMAIRDTMEILSGEQTYTLK